MHDWTLQDLKRVALEEAAAVDSHRVLRMATQDADFRSNQQARKEYLVEADERIQMTFVRGWTIEPGRLYLDCRVYMELHCSVVAEYWGRCPE